MTDGADASAAAEPARGSALEAPTIKVGVVLPSFRPTADDALDVARQADDAGIDGVFCYDHLWPMGRPDRPALAPFPLLAAVASRTTRLAVGPLVARVGIVPERVLVAELAALAALAPGRVVAALGTGDRLSAAENEAYGLPFPPAADRREELRRCVRALTPSRPARVGRRRRWRECQCSGHRRAGRGRRRRRQPLGRPTPGRRRPGRPVGSHLGRHPSGKLDWRDRP